MAVMFLVRKYVERETSPTITQVVIKTRRGFPTLGHSWPAPRGLAARQSKSHWRQCAPPRSSAIPPPFPPSTALRPAWRPLIEFSKLGDGTTIEQAAGPPQHTNMVSGGLDDGNSQSRNSETNQTTVPVLEHGMIEFQAKCGNSLGVFSMCVVCADWICQKRGVELQSASCWHDVTESVTPHRLPVGDAGPQHLVD